MICFSPSSISCLIYWVFLRCGFIILHSFAVFCKAVHSVKTWLQVTRTVAAVVFSFIGTNLPSALLVTCHCWYNFQAMSRQFYTLNSLSNCLVVTGKTINFFLFCTSSPTFRQRLVCIIGHYLRGTQYSSSRPYARTVDNTTYRSQTQPNNMIPMKVDGKFY